MISLPPSPLPPFPFLLPHPLPPPLTPFPSPLSLPPTLSILLPIVADLLLHGLLPNETLNSSRADISTFGFLYGTFPTAPTVFVFASQYSLAMEIVSIPGAKMVY